MNSATSLESADPPLNAYLSRPPNLSRILANTTRSATASVSFSTSESDAPFLCLVEARSPAWKSVRTTAGLSVICLFTPS